MYNDESCKVDSRITARLVNAVYMVCKDHNIILNNILVFPNLYNGFVKIGPYLNIIRILERGNLYIWSNQGLHELTRFFIPLKIRSLIQIRPTQQLSSTSQSYIILIGGVLIMQYSVYFPHRIVIVKRVCSKNLNRAHLA